MEDLEARKLYQILPDREAAREGYIRVVDESGEDYVYPSDLFVPVRLPAAVVRRCNTSAKLLKCVSSPVRNNLGDSRCVRHVQVCADLATPSAVGATFTADRTNGLPVR